MRAQVDTLVILGNNPVYNAPADLKLGRAQAKAKSAVIRLGYFEDETFAASTWHLPMTHYLEAWGDARSRDGTLVPVQPLVYPLFGGVTGAGSARAGWPASKSSGPYQIVRDTFKAITGADHFEENWKQFLHDGFWAKTASPPVAVEFAAERLAVLLKSAAPIAAPARTAWRWCFTATTKWTMVAGTTTAGSRNARSGQQTDLGRCGALESQDGGSVRSAHAAANRNRAWIGGLGRGAPGGADDSRSGWVQPGMADFSVGLALGYGRQKTEKGGTGRVGHRVGAYNAYELRTVAAPHFVVGRHTAEDWGDLRVSCTQEHARWKAVPSSRGECGSVCGASAFLPRPWAWRRNTAHMPLDAQGQPKRIYEHPYAAYADRKAQGGVDLSRTLLKSDVHQWACRSI